MLIVPLFLLIPHALAAPTSTHTHSPTSPPRDQPVSTRRSHSPGPTAVVGALPANRPTAHPTIHSLPIPTRTQFTFSRTHSAPPDRTPGLGGPKHGGHRVHEDGGQKPVIIAFEVVGALLGCLFLFGLTRCFWKTFTTPKRDRVADIVSRHQLQREMEQRERNPFGIRRLSLQEPAPPYFPPPPSYDDTLRRPTPPPDSERQPAEEGEYTAVPEHSPPASPSPQSDRQPLHHPSPQHTNDPPSDPSGSISTG